MSGYQPQRSRVQQLVAAAQPQAQQEYVKQEPVKRPDLRCCDNAGAMAEYEVRKDGPNKGRRFVVCSRERDDPQRCKDFFWLAEDGTPLPSEPPVKRARQERSDHERAVESKLTTLVKLATTIMETVKTMSTPAPPAPPPAPQQQDEDEPMMSTPPPSRPQLQPPDAPRKPYRGNWNPKKNYS